MVSFCGCLFEEKLGLRTARGGGPCNIAGTIFQYSSLQNGPILYLICTGVAWKEGFFYGKHLRADRTELYLSPILPSSFFNKSKENERFDVTERQFLRAGMAARSSNRGRLSGGRHSPEKLEGTFDWINSHFCCCCCCYFGSSLAQLPPSRCASINDFPDLLLGILVVSYLNRLRAEERITRLFRRTFFTAPAGVYFFSERKN